MSAFSSASPVVKLKIAEASDDDPANEEGKQPSFCVLLYGSLKVERMVAICHLGGEWYGMLYSWGKTKKKSSLMLSTFEPGPHTISWLGKFKSLGPIGSHTLQSENAFPVKPAKKKSYSNDDCVLWIKQSELQADIQKILKHARRLPEKTQSFYRELNRLRRGILSYGFYDLFDGMANILDRECTLLPASAHPDAALQLTHSANALRYGSRDYNSSVLPLKTTFSTD